MPAKSKKQQRLMGMAYAAKKGELPSSKLSPEIKKIMDSMSKKQIRDFAKTKTSDLPEKTASDKPESSLSKKDSEGLKDKLKIVLEKNGISKIKGGNTRALNLKQYKLDKKAAAVDPDYASGFRDAIENENPVNVNLKMFDNPFHNIMRSRSNNEWKDIGLMGGLGTLGYMGGSMLSKNPLTRGLTTLGGIATAKALIDTGKDKQIKNFLTDLYSAVKGPKHSKFREWISKYIPAFGYKKLPERLKDFYKDKFQF